MLHSLLLVIGLLMTLALFFTLVRLLASPFCIPILLRRYYGSTSRSTHCWLTLFFIGLSFTDFLDGYCARLFNQVTLFGAFLDPLADKILFLSTILTLLSLRAVSLYPALFLLVREFWVMGLRELGLLYGLPLPVIWSAKIKTALQMIFLAWIIVRPELFFGRSKRLSLLQNFLLVGVLAAAYLSAYYYSVQLYQGMACFFPR